MKTHEYDLGEPQVAALFGLDSSGDRLEDARPDATLLKSGIRRLLLARESGKEPLLMEGQLQQVLAHFGRDLSGSQILQEFGFRMYSHPETLPSDFDWAWVRFGKARALLVRHGDTVYVVSMASAHKSNKIRRNDFSELMHRIIACSQPDTVYVATVSRMVRNLEHAPRIEDVIKRSCRRIVTIDMEIDLTSANGTMLWAMSAMIAAGDRDLIAQRLFSGRVHMWRNNRWPFGDGPAVPLGYKVVDGHLILDPEQAQLLRSTFELLADESLPLKDAADAIRELGIGRFRTALVADDGAVDGGSSANRDVLNPQLLKNRLLRWVDVYLTGQYRLVLTCPYRGLESVLGLPVETIPSEDGARDVVYLPFEVEKPDVPPELLVRAREVRESEGREGPRKGHPLNSWTWDEPGFHYWLRGTTRGDRYELLQTVDTGMPWTKYATNGGSNGTLIASVNASELHRSMVEAFADGFDSGVLAGDFGLVEASSSFTGRTPQDLLRSRIDYLSTQAEALLVERGRCISRAGKVQDDQIADELLANAQQCQAEHDRLMREVAEFTVRLDEPLPELTDFDTDASLMIAALSILPREYSTVTQQMRSDLSRVIDGFRLDVSTECVRWECYLMLPANDRLLRVGPFFGTVGRLGRVLPPATLTDASSDSGVALKRADFERALRNRGFPKGAAKCASYAPGMFLPRVILGEDLKWPDCPDDFDHEEFNNYLRSVWTKDVPWSGKQYLRTNEKRQILTDLVAAAGGRLSLAKTMAAGEALGLGYQAIQYLTRQQLTRQVTRPWLGAVEREGEWKSTGSREDHFLVSRRCLKCGDPATAAVRVCEVPGDLLCRTCRVPTVGKPRVFPQLYVDMALPPTFIPKGLLR